MAILTPCLFLDISSYMMATHTEGQNVVRRTRVKGKNILSERRKSDRRSAEEVEHLLQVEDLPHYTVVPAQLLLG